MEKLHQNYTIPAALEAFLPEIIALRQDIHQHPELSLQEFRTAELIAEKLADYGYEVTTGIGKTGVVGTLKRGNGTKAIGLRADMDALPVIEKTDLPFKSINDGVMHACGHDGHIAILLAAAKYLAEYGQFNGTLNVIFQPAEENKGGAKLMLDDGLFERFPCDAIFGLHNFPNVPFANFGFRTGAFMASFDNFDITIIGKGGHGAMPQDTQDPIVTAGSIIMALQTIVSRNVSPTETAVVTIGSIHGGHINNVIPSQVKLQLCVRAYTPEIRNLLKQQIYQICEAQAQSFNSTVYIDYQAGYPVVYNDPEIATFVQQIASQYFGADKVNANFEPIAGSEDFAYFLEQIPGCYLILGTGPGENPHHDQFTFNDEVIGYGASLWIHMVENFLPITLKNEQLVQTQQA